MSFLAQPASACSKHMIETRELILDFLKKCDFSYLLIDMHKIVSRSASYIHLKDECKVL